MFTVIIPTYKRKTELLKLLKELNQQTFKKFEVIVINDDPETTIELDSKTYNYELKCLNNLKNHGPAYSRNKGIESSNYEWIVFCDDDDKMYENKLEEINYVIKNNPNVNFIVHRGIINLVNEKKEYKTMNRIPNYFNELLVFNNVGGTPFTAINKSILKLEKFDTELNALEDYDLWIRLFNNPDIQPYCLKKELISCNYFTNKESVSKNILNNKQAWNKITEKYQKDILLLSSKDKKRRNSFYYAMIGYKYLLNYQKIASFYYLRAFINSYNFKYLLVSLISLVNIRIVLKLR